MPEDITGREIAIAVAGFTAVAEAVLNLREDVTYTTNTMERDALTLAIMSELQRATQE